MFKKYENTAVNDIEICLEYRAKVVATHYFTYVYKVILPVTFVLFESSR